MTKYILLFLLCLLPCHAVDEIVLLQAIALKEQGVRTGKHGELGMYQMMPGTVKDAGGYDMVSALNHLQWLERNLKRRGVTVNVFNLAAAWNAGLDRYTSGRAKEQSYQYALAVQRLYDCASK